MITINEHGTVAHIINNLVCRNFTLIDLNDTYLTLVIYTLDV